MVEECATHVIQGEWCGKTPHSYVWVASEGGLGTPEGFSTHKDVSKHVVRAGEVFARDCSGPASVSSCNDMLKHVVHDSRLGEGSIGLEVFSTHKGMLKCIVHISGMLEGDTGGLV